MRDIPIAVLLSFPRPNYVDLQTQGMSLVLVNAVMAGLVLFAVVLRMYTRVWMKRWVGTDDYAIVLATIFTIGLNVTVILANSRYYWDRHIWDIPFDEIHSVGKIAIAAKAMFVSAAFFTRVSLLCFYYRLTVDTGLVRYRWSLHCTMVFNLAIFLVFLPLAIFQCRPIRAYWTFASKGVCIDEGSSTLAAGVINCVADLLVTVIPIPMIMRLKMPLKQRIGVGVLLSLGIIVTTAGIIRTYFIWKALIFSYDQTWYAYPLWICAAVEIDLAVLCACAPTLRPLLIKLAKPLLTSISSMYDKGVGSSTSKAHGPLSSNATGPRNISGNTAINSSVDHELKKIDAVIDVHDRSRENAPMRKWSTNWNRSGPEEDAELPLSPRLVINASQTFEVRHEDRTQALRPSQDSYVRLDDTTHDLRNQWQKTNKGFGHRPNVSSLTSNKLIIADSPPLRFLTGDQESDPKMAGRAGKHITPTVSPIQESFYISAPSASGSSDASLNSGKFGKHWPMESGTAETSRSRIQAEGRPSDVVRNPFDDEHKGQGAHQRPQGSTSSRIVGEHARWGNVPDVHETLARKRSLSVDRMKPRQAGPKVL